MDRIVVATDGPMNEHSPIPAPDPTVAETLNLGEAAPWWRRHLRLLGILVVTVFAAVAAAVYGFWPQPTQYKTEAAQFRTIKSYVTATGTLRPLNQVDVGVEVSGTLVDVLADFNDRVAEGDVLARVDTDRLEAQLSQTTANLEQAKANLIDARAAAQEARSRFRRAEQLHGRGFVSDQGLDGARATRDRANAAIASAAARVSVAEAAVQSDTTALSKAVIRAPINGIVLSRTIEPGQTVAATFQTPILFTLAEDLSKMELHVDIDEADIGSIAEGQDATFQVDAYPGQSFEAKLISIRNAPQTIQGVVTYESILSVDNSALILKPGMTATAEILVAEVQEALSVPSSALRFAPAGEETVPPTPIEGEFGQASGQVFVQSADGSLIKVSVTTGLTDNTFTEVLSGDLQQGDAVVFDLLLESEDE